MPLRALSLLVLSSVVACQDEARPPRYPAPPPPPVYWGPAPPGAQAPPPVTQPLPEAGSVTLSAALLVGGNGMSQPALDASTEQFIQSFNAGVAYFRQCYAPGLQRNPNLAGRITAHVVIASNGAVYDLQKTSVELVDAAVADCAFEAFRKLRYAPPAGQLFAVDAPVLFVPR